MHRVWPLIINQSIPFHFSYNSHALYDNACILRTPAQTNSRRPCDSPTTALMNRRPIPRQHVLLNVLKPILEHAERHVIGLTSFREVLNSRMIRCEAHHVAQTVRQNDFVLVVTSSIHQRHFARIEFGELLLVVARQLLTCAIVESNSVTLHLCLRRKVLMADRACALWDVGAGGGHVEHFHYRAR